MESQKQKRKVIVLMSLSGALMAFLLLPSNTAKGQSSHELVSNPDLIAELNQEIEEKKQRINELQQEAATYQSAVDQAASEVSNIESQISGIDAQLSITNFEIQSKEEEIAKITLEMEAVQLSIDDKNTEVTGQREQLAGVIKELDRASRTPLINILLMNSNFSEFFNEAQAYASLSDSLEQSVATIQRLKDELQAKHTTLASSKDELDQAKLQLEINRQSDVDQRAFQSTLLATAEQSEDQYSALLQQSLQAEQQANAIINSLERQVQDSLGGAGEENFTSTGFLWPVRGIITAYFRDPSYPFRCVYFNNPSCLEHSGLDIAVPQGTPVRATADGTVVAFANYTTSKLNYVSLYHGSGITSRYLHLNRVLIGAEQFVKQGDIIGYSGGIPGTAGSGGITTGPHLHLEIRVDGLPDDPLRYLGS